MPSSIGDLVWYDGNNNGSQDGGEDGVPGIPVELRNQAGLLLESTNTDASGNYLFENLPAGAYVVAVVNAVTGDDLVSEFVELGIDDERLDVDFPMENLPPIFDFGQEYITNKSKYVIRVSPDNRGPYKDHELLSASPRRYQDVTEARDPEGQTVTFSMTSSYFVVSSSTGKVSMNAGVDHADIPGNLVLTVTATDGVNSVDAEVEIQKVGQT